MADLETALLPMLSHGRAVQFNVFDVMHHGTHEKQLSNVFGWLLDTRGSHHLHDTFLSIFIDEVNRSRAVPAQFAVRDFLVLQEVNTSDVPGEAKDIADLVLISDAAVLVVENYYTSDGHGHSYDRYLRHSQRHGKQGAVVLLCHDHDFSRQSLGWEEAAVVTYTRLVDRLWQVLQADARYQREHAEPYAFIDQMHRKFVKGRSRMDDREVLDFVVALCATNEAGRYGEQQQETAAERFANDVAEQARERFGEGRELLLRIKHQLVTYCRGILRPQLDGTLGEGFVGEVSARYQGVYQWTINFTLPALQQGDRANLEEARLQLKFGPSAWYANEQDPGWAVKVDAKTADYSRLFITWAATRGVSQSLVSLQEVLDGLGPDDRRLHDEIMQVIRGTG